MSKKLTIAVGAALTLSMILAGCAPDTGTVTQSPSSAPAAPDGNDAAEPTENEPATQEETCDWDSARLASDPADAPSGTRGDLATVLIGAWQHTHIDEGAGFEALGHTTDIRYVFPSTTRLLYCQDVAGATSQAENAVDFTLDGTEIVLPSPASGYAVTAWDKDTMVWTNHRDGSLYLLQRR